MPKTRAEVINQAELILQDSGNAIFAAADLGTFLDDALSEVSEFVPLMVKETAHAQNGSLEVDISSITDLVRVDKVEWPIDQIPKQYRNFRVWGDYLSLELKTPPYASACDVSHENDTSDDLTGTVTFTADSTAITGSGTAFLSEIEVGDYISKSGSSNWYKVIAIASNTVLTVGHHVLTEDNGTDSANSTEWWDSRIYLHCAKKHRLNPMTDLVGAVNNALGYAEGIKSMAINGLQSSGTIYKNTTFKITGIDGIYTVTADATIATNAATISFYPGLAAAVANATVVTFETSTLTPELERLVAEATAARAAQAWVGAGRTALNSAVTAAGNAATHLGTVAARVLQAVQDINTGRTEANKAATIITAAGTAIGKVDARLTQVITDIGSARTDAGNIAAIITAAQTPITAILAIIARAILDINSGRTEAAKVAAIIGTASTALDKMDAQLTLAQSALTTGDDLINTIPIGDQPETDWAQYSGQWVNAANGRFAEANANFTEAAREEANANSFANLAMAELRVAQEKINEAQVNFAKVRAEESAASTYINVGIGELRLAQGRIQEANANLAQAAADDASARTYYANAASELSAGREYIQLSQGYLSESVGRINISRAFMSYQAWAANLLAEVRADLRRLRKPQQTGWYAR